MSKILKIDETKNIKPEIIIITPDTQKQPFIKKSYKKIKLQKNELLVGPPDQISQTNGQPVSDDKSDPMKKHTEDLLYTAKQQAELIEREAYQKAFELGEKAGREIGEKKLEPIIKSLSSILKDLSSFRENIYKNYEKEIILLAFHIAKKIIFKEISEDDTVIINIVKEAISKAINETNIHIKVSPDDYDYLSSRLDNLKQILSSNKNFTIEVVENLKRGDCLIETKSGVINAKIEDRINEIKSNLL
jgi:flagellar assembly protein FliH